MLWADYCEQSNIARQVYVCDNLTATSNGYWTLHALHLLHTYLNVFSCISMLRMEFTLHKFRNNPLWPAITSPTHWNWSGLELEQLLGPCASRRCWPGWEAGQKSHDVARAVFIAVCSLDLTRQRCLEDFHYGFFIGSLDDWFRTFRKRITAHVYRTEDTSRARASRVAEVSRFKKCNALGSRDKVCL